MLPVQPKSPDLENSLFQRIRRLTVEEHHQWIASGMLTPDDPVELLEGIIVEKMPVYSPHSFVTDEIRYRLMAILPDGYFARSQQPITLSNSEPEPDGFIVRGRKRAFPRCHRRPGTGPD